MWKCSKCGEEIRANFKVCWSCGTTIDGQEDPEFFDDSDKDASQLPYGEAPTAGDRSEERLVTVRTCSLPAEAHAVRIKLETASIPVFLADEFTVTMDWLLANAIGGIKVQVPEADYERACALLTEHDASNASGEDEDEFA